MTRPSDERFSPLSGKKVLVTGGTGFVGRHLLPRLLAAGAHVTCLTRAASRTGHLPADVAVARADLRTGEGLAEALAGQDVVIQMAALLFDVEAAAQGSGKGLPARFVLVSSLAATGPSDCPPGVADNAVPAPVSAYGWSKLLVEQILGRALGDRLVTLRPPIIYGSGDKGLLPVFKGAARGFAVSPGAFRDFPVSAVHARDMAQAVLLCCKDTARGVYHINDGGLYSMAHFCRVMGAALGRPRLRVIHLPLPLMAVTAGLASSGGLLWARLSRCLPSRAPQRAPNWNLDKYREARQAGWLCDAARIRRELGYEPRVSLAEGMAEAVEGYRREGWL